MQPRKYIPPPEKIGELLETLCSTRRSVKKGEKGPKLEIYSQLKSMGFKTTSSSFKHIPRISKRSIRILIVLFLSLMNSAFLFFGYFNSAFVFLVLITFSHIFESLISRRRGSWTNIKKALSSQPEASNPSQNLVVSIKASKTKEFDMKMANVVLLANYDSVEYKWKSGTRYIVYRLFLVIMAFSVFLNIVCAFSGAVLSFQDENFLPLSHAWFSPLLVVTSAFTTLHAMGNLVLILAENEIGSNSFGAVDNTSSCAILLSLLNRIKQTKTLFNWCNLTFAFIGKDQIDPQGTKSFLNTHRAELAKYKDVYFVSLDGFSKHISVCSPPENRAISVKTSTNKDPSDTLDILEDIIKHHAIRLNIKTNSRCRTGKSSTFLSRDNYTPHLKILPRGKEFFVERKISQKMRLFRSKMPECDAICLWDPSSEVRYTPRDDPQKVDNIVMSDVLELLHNTILTLDDRIENKVNFGE